MPTSKIFNVLILGAGSIGAGYDHPGDSVFLTHAHAFSSNPNFRLLGFVDSNLNVAIAAAEKWGCSYFESVEGAFDNNIIDVICVAVPDHYHYETLKFLTKYKNVFFLVEKPLTRELSEAKELVEILKNNDTRASINFKRGFIPEIVNIKRRSRNGELGKLLYAQGYYNKGFKHNGSHLLHLFISLTGIVELKVKSYLGSIIDFTEEDPSHSFLLSNSDDCQFLIKAFREQNYPIFELDLHFEKERIRIFEAGKIMEHYKVEQNNIFNGHSLLQKVAEYETEVDKSMLYAAENIHQFLANKQGLLVPIEDGLRVMELTNDILSQIE